LHANRKNWRAACEIGFQKLFLNTGSGDSELGSSPTAEEEGIVKPSVASVTIAYNAAESLPKQIEALLAQTFSLREIIVVDNASTDGTCAMLAERFPQVTVLRMSENLGAAGAWAAGLTYAALKKGHDWIWSFDDDSVPDSTTLETMVAGLEESRRFGGKVGMAVPMGVSRTGAYYPPWFWRDGFAKPTAEQIRQPIWFADLAMASGSLVQQEVVLEIGVPRADFFMDVFDLEFCLRARSRGYRIAVISGAKLTHEIGNTREVRLFGTPRHWMTQPPWREYYISRNLTYLAWGLYPNFSTKISIARYLAVHFAGVLLFSSRKFACAARVIQGIGDGLRGRLGIRLRPGVGGSRKRSVALAPTEKVEAGKA
jgi:GT2 family glycosyltransferase